MNAAFRSTVFIDTSYFVAFLNQRDEHHARAEGLQVTRAQTADHHFEQAGFEILLKPA